MRARLVLVPTVYLTRKIRDAEEAVNGAIRRLDYRYGMAAGETEMKAVKAMKSVASKGPRQGCRGRGLRASHRAPRP